MYESYFKLRESPFSLTPDPRFLFTNASVQEAFATLCFGIEQRKGLIAITGEPGTGKTTLLKLFMQNSAPEVHKSCILDPHLTFVEMLQCVFRDFGLPPCPADRLTMTEQLNGYLVEQLKRDHVVALVLDEAQDIDDPVLEELRLLLDLEAGGKRLLQIVLVGQPALDARWETTSLRPLKQRMTLRAWLRPLDADEIRSYIDFRLTTAGYTGEAIFMAPAVERIALLSRGIPRLINVICDNALLIACATSRESIGVDVIDEVAEDLQLDAPSPRAGSWAPKISPKQQAPAQAAAKYFREPAVVNEMPRDREEGDFPPSDVIPAPTIGAEAAPVSEVKPGQTQWAGLAIACATLTLVIAVVFAAQQSAVSLAPMTAPFTSIKEALTPLPGRIYRGLMPLTTSEEGGIDPAADGLAIRSQSVPARESRKSPPPGLDNDTRDRAKASVRPRREGETRSPRVQRDAAARASAAKPAPADHVVVENSFVRKQPTAESEILVTLRPGTHVQIVRRSGDYLQVRSQERGLTAGYVHKEDAFFEPLN